MSEGAGENLSGRTALVTGATGFIGSRLAARLLRDGAHVRALARATSPAAAVDELRSLGAEIVHGDVTDPASLRPASAGVDVVFHVAGHFRQAAVPDRVYHDVNVEGVRHVLDEAERAGVARVVHCSTIGVHGRIPRPPVDEEEPFRPGDLYQESKAEGERLARARFQEGRVRGVVIRPAMVWGAGDRRTLKLFRGVARRRFPIVGSGAMLTHWVDVEDVAEAFRLAALRDVPSGRVYIVAGERPVRLAELVGMIARLAGVRPLPLRVPLRPLLVAAAVTEAVCRPLGIEPPLHRRRVHFFTNDRAFDTSRARAELGFRPRRSLEEEVEHIYRWYERHGWI